MMSNEMNWEAFLDPFINLLACDFTLSSSIDGILELFIVFVQQSHPSQGFLNTFSSLDGLWHIILHVVDVVTVFAVEILQCANGTV